MEMNQVMNLIGYQYLHEGKLPHENSNYLADCFKVITEVNKNLFAQIPFEVIFTESDVYESAKIMRERVIAEKKIYIYTGSTGHPFLNYDDNNIGRAVHDVYAHLVCGCPFTFQGEYNAFLTQAKYYPDYLFRVLFAEIPAQTAAYYQNKDFSYTQRAFFAPQEWVELCKDYVKDYSSNSVMQPFTNLYNKG